MVFSHCTGPGLGPVHGQNGKYSTVQKCPHCSQTETGTEARAYCYRTQTKFLHVSVCPWGQWWILPHPGPYTPRDPTSWAHTPRDHHLAFNYKSRRYASYWNAFLFSMASVMLPIPVPDLCQSPCSELAITVIYYIPNIEKAEQEVPVSRLLRKDYDADL